MIKIAYLEENALIGGAGINVINLLKHLDRTEFDPLVICPFEGPLTDRIKQIGSRVAIVPRFPLFPTSTFILGKKIFNPIATLYNFVALFPSAWKLANFLKLEKVDILHTNSMLAHFYGAIASKLAGVRCLWHFQDIVEPGLCFGFVEKALKWAGTKLPDRIVAISKAVGRMFDENVPDKVRIVYNGTNIERYAPGNNGAAIRNELGISSKKIVVGIIGRIVQWKGHREFLQAAKLILGHMPDVKFFIVGDATFGRKSYFQEIKNLTVKLGLKEAVIFTGFREDIPNVLAAMDIFIHASTLPEPFGLVIVEAMASGKPVVATQGGGVPEIVEHGKTGLLVPMGDYKALAQATIQYISDPDMRLKMGKAGRERVAQSFSIQRFVENMSKQYIRLARG